MFSYTVSVRIPDEGDTHHRYGPTNRDFAMAANKAMEIIYRNCEALGVDYRSVVVQFWRSGNNRQRKPFTYRFLHKDNALLATVCLSFEPYTQLPITCISR
jgi:hypothetical protein